MALLYNNRFLFSGDHLWWDRDLQQLGTPENLVWDDAQLEQSVRTLLNYSFEWVLPGHGERIHLPGRDMKNAVEKLIQGPLEPQGLHNLELRFQNHLMMGVEVDRRIA